MEESLSSRFDVSGFPTIKFFKNGKPTEYAGGRTKKEIVAYLKKKSGPAAQPIATAEEADAGKQSNDIAVFGVFESAESPEAKAFVEAAESIELMFFIVTDPAVATHLEATAPAVIIHTDFEETPFKYDGDFTSVQDITKFCVGSSLPLVIEFTDEVRQILSLFFASSMLHYVVHIGLSMCLHVSGKCHDDVSIFAVST